MSSSGYYQNSAKVRGLSLSQLGLMTFFLQALVIGALIAGLIVVFSFDVASTQEKETRHSAHQLENQIMRFVHHYQAITKNIAEQKTVKKYYLENKQKSLKVLSQILTANDPEVLAIRFRSATDSKTDKSIVPHLGYAGLDMLRDVAENKVTPIEVHSPNSKNAHIAFGARVMDGDKLIGLVHVSVGTSQLKSMANSIQLNYGVLQIQQKLDQQTVNLATAGDSGLLGPEPIDSVVIAESKLQISYWTGSSFSLLYSVMFLKYWVVCVVIVLLLGALQVLMSKRAASILKKDQVTILTLFEDFLQGRLETHYPAKLLDSRGTLEAMTKRAAENGPISSVVAVGEKNEFDSDDDDLLSVSDEPQLDDMLSHPFPESDTLDDNNLLLDDALMIDDPMESVPQSVAAVPDNIFLAYDIRGVVDSGLTTDVAHSIGLSIGSEAQDQGETSIIVGRDGRLSSPSLAEALINGISASGCHVIDIGLVPTPVLSFATHILDTQSGVMVTGSHNPPNYNGFKVTIKGEPLHSEAIQGLKLRIRENRLASGSGQITQQSIITEYISQITEDVQLGRPLKVVVDCGHGVGAEVAPALFGALGIDIIELNCQVDGHFPSHHPDPSRPENMQQLIDTVKDKQADLGIAFDGDADRLGVVDAQGKIIWPDRLLMLFAMDILSRQPGADVVFDVKCTRHLAKEIVNFGGRPIMWKTGHSMVRAKLKETNAALAGEFSGHIFINERWYGFDDGIYASCRLFEILSADFRGSDEVFAELPESTSTPEIMVPTSEGENHSVMQQLANSNAFDGGNISDLDGLRVEYEHGWGLIRASNTTSNLVVRLEGDDDAAINNLLTTFNGALQSVAPHLTIQNPNGGSSPSIDLAAPSIDDLSLSSDDMDFSGLSLDEDFGYKE
ncbi:MAG: phosphomannomutase/phosphoglucomutase [Methylococcales bacterium]|nr:phosphomannomutase/phosphoglucomutase [Methylococcales bacterium]